MTDSMDGEHGIDAARAGARERLHAPGSHPRVAPMQFFHELMAYVDFTDEDAHRMRQLEEVVAPIYDEVVEAFYQALWSNSRTRMVFEGLEQMDRLRRALRAWIEELFTGPYDQDYFARRHRIGKVHVDVGLLPHFMFGAMNVIRNRLIGHLLVSSHFEGQESRRRQSVETVEKMLDLELTIMVQSYWDSMMELKLQVPAALATGLAHEIRNPLNAINLNIALMERRLRGALEDTSQFDSILEVMRSEVRRIRGLTSEIMDFAKPVHISPRWHDARELLREIDLIHGPTLEVSEIELQTHLEGDPVIWCDLDRFKQVLVNLITNAVEAIGERGRIELSLRNAEDGSTIIELRDDGEGMPPGLRYRIFDLFYTTKAAGTGLGLPIVRKIVEAHDGVIDVVSRVGQGSAFKIQLPRPKTSGRPRRASDPSPREDPNQENAP